MGVKLDREFLKGFVSDSEISEILPQIQKAHNDLENKTGAGSDYLGWKDLPGNVDEDFLDELEKLGKEVRDTSDAIVSIGIGGSYLGIRATEEFLRDVTCLPIYYAGHNMSVDYIYNLLGKIKEKKITVVVISKSGTTTEPAVAFRIIKKFMKERYSEDEMRRRIICVTDEKKGALRQVVNENGYRSFVIPDDVGGRFSILTPVGLVPLALAGVDIKKLIEGAKAGQEQFSEMDLENNACYQYAALRYLLYRKGKIIEVLSSFYDNMQYVNEWWKQLFGESEGKNGKGIFPASLILSTDLHSMGQLMQDGMRNVFETFIDIKTPKYSVIIPSDEDNLDNFNIIADKDLDFVNKKASRATKEAHFEGGVPNMTINICKSDEFHLGKLYYFFERAVAISGYLLEVNPFDQPGVEAYKSKMFKLLGKS